MSKTATLTIQLDYELDNDDPVTLLELRDYVGMHLSRVHFDNKRLGAECVDINVEAW